jgi:cytochrome c6
MSSGALRTFALRALVLTAASASIAGAAGCGDDESASSSATATPTAAPAETTPAAADEGSTVETASTGKEIFMSKGCAGCHTLADAGAKGTMAPNLDEEKPPLEEIIELVTNGDGKMPSYKDRLTAEEIETVAKYVAEVEGK